MILLSSPAAKAQNVILHVLDKFNVIAGNYSAGNETEGSAFVSGTYTPGGQSRFAFNSGSVQRDETNVLWLNNGVANSNRTTLISGSVVSRTSVSSNLFNLNGNGQGNPSINQGAAAWSSAIAGLGYGLTSTTNLVNTVRSASSQWAALTANSTVRNTNNGAFTFTATPGMIDGHSVAVFNVSSSVFSTQNIGRLEAQMNGAETLLINVSGLTANINADFANGFTNNESKIIFNFYEATTVNVNRNFRGGIYAPLATVNQLNGNFDGTVVANVLNQKFEIHDKRFDGYLPYNVPEPSAPLLAAIGASLALCVRRR